MTTSAETTAVDNGWRFNRSYKDLTQVEAFLPDFMKRLEELESNGEYRYDDSFLGHISGIAGPNEMTGVYLLQGLQRQKEQDVKVARLLEEGYRHITELEAVTKFSHVVVYPPHGTSMIGEWHEERDARVVPHKADIGGLSGILPKGKRTHGFQINGRAVLVKD